MSAAPGGGGITDAVTDPQVIGLGVGGAVLGFVFRTLWKQEAGWERVLAASREDAKQAREDAAAARVDADAARADAKAARADAAAARAQEQACREMYARQQGELDRLTAQVRALQDRQ